MHDRRHPQTGELQPAEKHSTAAVVLPLRPTTVRAAWFTLAIEIYRGYEAALDSAGGDRTRARAVRRLKAARPSILHMLRDADLDEADRAYLARLLKRIERYFIYIPADKAAA